jgi:hypothetical protein
MTITGWPFYGDTSLVQRYKKIKNRGLLVVEKVDYFDIAQSLSYYISTTCKKQYL